MDSVGAFSVKKKTRKQLGTDTLVNLASASNDTWPPCFKKFTFPN